MLLEESLSELSQMFIDFALLIEEQGIMLGRIETNIMQSSEHIDNGNFNVKDSIKILKSIRRKQCCVASIIIIIIFIAIIVVIINSLNI